MRAAARVATLLGYAGVPCACRGLDRLLFVSRPRERPGARRRSWLRRGGERIRRPARERRRLVRSRRRQSLARRRTHRSGRFVVFGRRRPGRRGCGGRRRLPRDVADRRMYAGGSRVLRGYGGAGVRRRRNAGDLLRAGAGRRWRDGRNGRRELERRRPGRGQRGRPRNGGRWLRRGLEFYRRMQFLQHRQSRLLHGGLSALGLYEVVGMSRSSAAGASSRRSLRAVPRVDGRRLVLHPWMRARSGQRPSLPLRLAQLGLRSRRWVARGELHQRRPRYLLRTRRRLATRPTPRIP